MDDELTTTLEHLIQKDPTPWLASACEILRSLPAATTTEVVLQRLPTTSNGTLSHLASVAVALASGVMSWEALSWTRHALSITYRRWQAQQHIEFLWAGPAPANQIPARRIDQALYDLIDQSKHEIPLVTFAAARIERLTRELWKAVERNVRIRAYGHELTKWMLDTDVWSFRARRDITRTAALLYSPDRVPRDCLRLRN